MALTKAWAEAKLVMSVMEISVFPYFHHCPSAAMRQYIVDAFTDKPFSGNPAAVCQLPEWPDDGWMRNMAMENNLSETAFLVPDGKAYRLRWFTPETEVGLCGHATLASAFVVLNFLERTAEKVEFITGEGVLPVRRDGELYAMDFPLIKALLGTDLMCVCLIAKRRCAALCLTRIC